MHEHDEDEEELPTIRSEEYIDPRTGFRSRATMFPVPPLEPEEPPPAPPPPPTFLQRHPYLGPIIGAVIVGAITIAGWFLKK